MKAAAIPWALCFIGAAGALLSGSLGATIASFETIVLSSYALAVRYGALTPKQALTRVGVDAVPAAWMLLACLYWARTLAPGARFVPGGAFAACVPAPSAGDLRVLLSLLFAGIGVQALRAPLGGLVTSQPEDPSGRLPPGARVLLVGAGLWGAGRISVGLFGTETLSRIGVLKLLLTVAAVAGACAVLRSLQPRLAR